MTPGEFYTAQFYSWECRGRGWYLSEHPVQLEPPFIPYFRHGYPQDQIDDGKHHTWISKFIEDWKGKKKPQEKKQELLDYEKVEPFEYVAEIELQALQVLLSKERKIAPEKMKALLVMFSYIDTPISFEIIGTESEIILQFVCDNDFTETLETYIISYFPNCSLLQTDIFLDDIFQEDLCTSVVDFGLQHECIRPIATFKQTTLDPLIGLFGVLDKLKAHERAGMQILFQPAVNRWGDSIVRSVTMYDGSSFFSDAPEFPMLANEKTRSPLYGVAIRAFAQAAKLPQAFALLERLSVAIMHGSKSANNQLIPLSTPAYDFQTRVDDIVMRESHRLGMLLNLDELLSMLHFPTESIASKKLFSTSRKTVTIPGIAKGKPFILGDNIHNGITTSVSFGIDERLRHTHIIGATGTGKSTLITNLVLQDIKLGYGVIVFDPHGDLVHDLLSCIPEECLEDVVYIDPADIEFPIGLNILEAHTDTEKEVLASDLVASFRKYATSWGDQMSTVLGNAILAILESPNGGTLHDLRRFLVEKEYRTAFLRHVSDPSIQYYWHKEFALLKTNSIGPILTRLDTFLRPKSIRNMLAQQRGLNFETLLKENKIILLKLSQGLIGFENSFILGSLILSQLHQAVLRRQQDEHRNPIFMYVDEFQHFITPSMKEMITGFRKYNVGLTLSHQDLHQLQREDAELLHSMLNNISNRVVFRVGESDAKKLQDSFANFDYSDFQNLGKGEAIVRIEQPQYNCSLTTSRPPSKVEGWQKNVKIIIDYCREHYATSRTEVELLLRQYFNLEPETVPVHTQPAKPKATSFKREQGFSPDPIQGKSPSTDLTDLAKDNDASRLSTHRYLQTLIKRMAEARGYIAVLEAQLQNSIGLVDVVLSREGKTMAIEICVTTDTDWEVHNIAKCIEAGYNTVVSVCGDSKQLEKIKRKCIDKIPDIEQSDVHFFTPDMLFVFLDSTNTSEEPKAQKIKGYTVNVTYEDISNEDMKRKRASVAQVVLNSLKKIKKKE